MRNGRDRNHYGNSGGKRMRSNISSLKHLLHTREGLGYARGALAQLKRGARFGASAVRAPDLRDELPSYVREDILTQSYSIMEIVGRCSFILILFEKGYTEENHENPLEQIFCTMYEDACQREQSLKKLCKLTFETYAPGKLADYTKQPDKEF
jgi:hypothetical protein